VSDNEHTTYSDTLEPAYQRASTAIVGAAAALALLLACPCAIASIFVARNFTSTADAEYRAWVNASAAVAWSGDGRFAVAQSSDGEGEPIVVAWDSETGEARTLTGFRLAAVERHGAVAWLVPIDRAELSEHLDAEWESVLVSSSGPFDTAPESLLAWDLTSAAPTPSTAYGTTWMRWPGPGEWSATALGDPTRGAYPSTLLLGESSDSADERLAILPGDFGTFDVVGWSPSGRYLALAEMLDVGADPADATRRIVIIDARNGALVAEARQGASRGHGALPAWLPDSDLLVWSELSDRGTVNGAFDSERALRVMNPEGSETSALEALDGPLPADWAAARGVMVYGSGPAGIVVGADLEEGIELSWLSGSVVRPAASLVGNVEAAVYHPDSGLLVVEGQLDEVSTSRRQTLVHFAVIGDQGRVVWEGEWREEER
jgi:hypothetical protein